MAKILVSGLINIETTVNIGNFPVAYSPVEYKNYGVESTVSGVGYNIAKAIKTLGDVPVLLSLIGNDLFKKPVMDELDRAGIGGGLIISALKNTPQSMILCNVSASTPK